MWGLQSKLACQADTMSVLFHCHSCLPFIPISAVIELYCSLFTVRLVLMLIRCSRCSAKFNTLWDLRSLIRSLVQSVTLLIGSVQFSLNPYFNVMALEAWSATDSLGCVICWTERQHFEFVSKMFSCHWTSCGKKFQIIGPAELFIVYFSFMLWLSSFVDDIWIPFAAGCDASLSLSCQLLSITACSALLSIAVHCQ